MILQYWWMHWFWITCLFLCHFQVEGVEPVQNRSSKFTEPIPTATTAIPLNASVKESTLNEATINTTMSTVIEQNDSNSDVSTHQTYHAQIIEVNNTESFFNITNGTTNQSLIVNSERIGSDEHSSGNLSAAGITGITLGCVSFVGIICAVTLILYRNVGFNKPQVLNDHCSNPDSSGYIDDSTVRENSEEMYSLDNDSFLNSLEAMTIQNLWTDSVKHTKL